MIRTGKCSCLNEGSVPGRVVFFKDHFVPESEAKISIYDSALMFGDCVFEMTRSFRKEQFKLREHIDRLYASAKFVHIKIPMTKEEMECHVYETMELNDPAFSADDEHRIMINVYRGSLAIYHGVAGTEDGPYVVISDFPLRWTVRSMGKLFDTGINAVIPSQRSIPAQFLDPKIKCRSRVHLQMANIEVSRVKGDSNWALLLDQDGFITEGTGDNFFIVRGNTAITPEPRNILRGVSRQYVMELSPVVKFFDHSEVVSAVEKNIDQFDVLEADEAFMTGTPFSILPVTSLNGTKIGNGKVGPVTKAYLKQWSNAVGVNIEQQIKNWDVENVDQVSGTTPYHFEEGK
jgi:branched-chain amino acid aminotransferase